MLRELRRVGMALNSDDLDRLRLSRLQQRNGLADDWSGRWEPPYQLPLGPIPPGGNTPPRIVRAVGDRITVGLVSQWLTSG